MRDSSDASIPHTWRRVLSEPAAEDPPFSDDLERWLTGDSAKSLGALSDVFAEKSFAVTILLLMFVPALPLPTGGITHVFEIITVLLAAEMVAGRKTIWLPRRWRRRELGAATTGKAIPFVIRRVRWFEKLSRPRFARVVVHPLFVRLLGLVIIVFTLAAFLAPPFSGLDTLPSLGVVGIALAIILEDVAVLAIGIAFGLVGIALIVTIGAAIAQFISDHV